MAAPFPPGNETRTFTEMQRDNYLLGFLKNEPIADFSKIKGNGYVFKMQHITDPKVAGIEQLKAAKTFINGLSLPKRVEWRYPTATRRVFGGTYPGEVERKARKTAERKATRAEVEMLCKYMLFKKKKFTPGKMI